MQPWVSLCFMGLTGVARVNGICMFCSVKSATAKWATFSTGLVHAKIHLFTGHFCRAD